jgi:hypothetical protein
MRSQGSQQPTGGCRMSRNISTARGGGQWSPTAVMHVMQRLGLELNKANAAPVSSQEAIPATLYG